MAQKEITVNIFTCDICGVDTEGFLYYEDTHTPFGVKTENRLAIDICESCCKEMYYDIPDFMYYERHDNEETILKKQNQAKQQVKKWRSMNEHQE